MRHSSSRTVAAAPRTPRRAPGPLGRLLDRLGHRLRRARPGSVLILVIALLVLMALIGTAFISTARTDRYAATHNTYNTQVGLLTQGVMDMTEGATSTGLQGGGVYRDAIPFVQANQQGSIGYLPWESPVNDYYLASRTPALYPPPETGKTGVPAWPFITAPVGGLTVDTPFGLDANKRPLSLPLQYKTTPDQLRKNVLPTFLTITLPDNTTRTYPALTLTLDGAQIIDPNSGAPAGNATQPVTILAADADGDGIADSVYVRLPLGQIEGATYFGAVRIIDNCAAINASVAMEPSNVVSSDKTRLVPGDFFPTNIDLLGMLALPNGSPSSDATSGYPYLNAWRFNNPAPPLPPTTNPPPAPPGSSAPNGENFSNVPIDDLGQPRPDFMFSTPSEALWFQMGSRISNPGFNQNTRYQPLPISEGAALLYHGGLCNLNAPLSPLLETLLPNATYSAAVARTPFLPSDVNTWFNTLYNYSTAAPYAMPLRPLMVVRNPVSNFAPSRFPDRTGQPGPFVFGDRVQLTDPNTLQPRGFVCIRDGAVSAPFNADGTYNNADWAAMPWSSHPTRINVNTGTFGQLWTAYWCVMRNAVDDNPTAPEIAAPGPVPQGSALPDISNYDLDRQFRNPIRYPYTDPTKANAATGPVLPRQEMIKFRSAIAAMNTIDQRDGDQDVSSRTIRLTLADGKTPVFATIYGAERQPYITEILVEYNPKSDTPDVPYVAVELYNPYPTPIHIDHWNIAKIVRGNGSLALQPVASLDTTFPPQVPPNNPPPVPHNNNSAYSGSIIGSGEHLVLESDSTKRPVRLAKDWSQRTPQPLNPPAVPGLEKVVGGEFVLMRPRSGASTPINGYSAGGTPENPFHEVNQDGSVNLLDWVPVDQIDLTGITGQGGAPPAPGQDPPFVRYRYARADRITTGPDSLAWHCVYPGPYNIQATGDVGGTGANPSFRYRHYGLKQEIYTDPNTAEDTGFANYKGAFNQGNGSATYETRPLQVNSRDSAGPNPPYHEVPDPKAPSGLLGPVARDPVNVNSRVPAAFPYGGFARNGDILNVPFIGAYRITLGDPRTGQLGALLEINSVTMDSVLAQYMPPYDVTPLIRADDRDRVTLSGGPQFHNEIIGHFCPMDVIAPTQFNPNGNTDFTDDPQDHNYNPNVTPTLWRYHWAKTLFDYLTVFSPQDDYMPNVDPAGFLVTVPDPNDNKKTITVLVSGDPTVATSSPKYPPYPPQYFPSPVPNGPSVTNANRANFGREDTASIEGTINLNSANWKVISAVPFFTPALQGATYSSNNVGFAYAIALARDTGLDATSTANPRPPILTDASNNPVPITYRSIFDLMKLPAYRTVNRFYVGNNNPGEAGNNQGALSPFRPFVPEANGVSPDERTPTDHVYGGVKTRFLGLERISNLVTVRSDSFTAYVQVQGWQNVGTTFPNLVAQRRAAAILDRSQVKPTRGTGGVISFTPPGVTDAPND